MNEMKGNLAAATSIRWRTGRVQGPSGSSARH